MSSATAPVSDGGDSRVLHLNGDLTVGTAEGMKVELVHAVEDSTALIVNLSGVTELDTAGLQILLLAKRTAEQTEKSISFVEPSRAVAQVFSIVGLQSDLAPVSPVASAGGEQ